MIKFFAEGVPVAQGSKNAFVRGGKVALVESSKTLPQWRQTVAQAAILAHDGDPIDQPVHVRAVFVMPRPKKPRFLTPAVTPDLDKMCRALGDALEQSGVLRNDSRITQWDARKIYAEGDAPTGVHVWIEAMS